MHKILVIEDESIILENIIEILEIGGYDAHGAEDGVRGVERAHELMPDLILCDINMPRMDGYGVLMELRSDPRMSRIPFVFLTAFAGREYQRKGMNLGAEDYLTKPFTPQEMLDTVEAQLNKQSTRVAEYSQELDSLRNSILLALPHELRTPLTGIVTCADILFMDLDESGSIDDARLRQMLSIIRRSGDRLQRVIENYLIYSQLELYANDPERKAQLLMGRHVSNPRTVIGDEVTRIAEQAQRVEDIQLNRLEDATVAMNEGNLKKLVHELVDNALKFSKAGNAVQIEGYPQEGNFVLIVTDEGRGMTADQVQHIGAYRQFERDRYEQQGLGLGLVIIKKLTELHNGALHIEPQDVGTQVTVRLPLA